jgi:hypothetical protein
MVWLTQNCGEANQRISESRNLFDESKLTREVTFQILGQPGAMR